MNGRSYMRRWLKPLNRRLDTAGLTYQALRRTFATQQQKFATANPDQTQLCQRSTSGAPDTSIQQTLDPVRAAMEALDQQLYGPLGSAKVVNWPKRQNGFEPFWTTTQNGVPASD
jgi:hypothetical protein